MDDEQFDALVARLVSAQSRRTAITSIVGGALASISVTTVGEAKRNKRRSAAARKKKKQRGDDDRRSGEGGDRDGNHRARRHRRQRRHKRRARHRDHGDKKKKNRRKKDRCKKNGAPCGKDNTCCSKHCSPVTGTCTRRPDS